MRSKKSDILAHHGDCDSNYRGSRCCDWIGSWVDTATFNEYMNPVLINLC